MKHCQIPFEEILVPLDQPNTTVNIKKYSPTGKVPALMDDSLTVWETLAIMEYLHEKYPEKKLYPPNPADRALARSLVSEMHAGFGKMREILSFDAKKTYPHFQVGEAAQDIERIKDIWTSCLKKSGGPFLFKDFSIADAMFAPVVCRFHTYDVKTDGLVKNYCETMFSLPAMKEWYAEAKAETYETPFHP